MVFPDGKVMNFAAILWKCIFLLPASEWSPSSEGWHTHTSSSRWSLTWHTTPLAHSAWFKGDPKGTNPRTQSRTPEHTCTLLFWLMRCRLDTNREACICYDHGVIWRTSLRKMLTQQKWEETRSSKTALDWLSRPALKPGLPLGFLVPWATMSLVYGASQLELAFLFLLVIKSILTKIGMKWVMKEIKGLLQVQW